MRYAIPILLCASIADAQDYINGPAWGPSFRQVNHWQTNHFVGPYIPPTVNWHAGNGLHRGSYGIVFDARTGGFLHPQPYYHYVRPVQLVRRCYWTYR